MSNLKILQMTSLKKNFSKLFPIILLQIPSFWNISRKFTIFLIFHLTIEEKRNKVVIFF